MPILTPARLGAVLLAGATLVALPACAAAPAAAAPPAPEAYGATARNWEGVWVRIGGATDPDTPITILTGGQSPPPESTWPPLTPEYKAKYAAIVEGLKRGERLNDPTANCLPAGFPWVMNMPYPMEIHQTATKLTIVAEWMGQIRRIYIGAALPTEVEPSYFGTSVGRWEGETLVVETIGLRGDTALNDSGLPHSDAMRVTERWSFKDGVLTDEITIVDPKALTTSWVSSRRYKKMPPDFRMMEYVCENNRDTVDMDTAGEKLKKALETKPAG